MCYFNAFAPTIAIPSGPPGQQQEKPDETFVLLCAFFPASAYPKIPGCFPTCRVCVPRQCVYLCVCRGRGG